MRYEWARVPESVPPAPAVRDAKPVMISVDDDPGVSRAVQRDLRRQYGEHYRVLRAESGAQGLEMLGQVRLRDEPVALMVADQRMPQMTGVEFLERALEVAPDAKRVLLTAYADTQAAIDAINKVALDHYLLKPWDPPEEQLYPVLDDLLADWQAGAAPSSTCASASSSTSSQRYGTLLRARKSFSSCDSREKRWPITRTASSGAAPACQSASRSSSTG